MRDFDRPLEPSGRLDAQAIGAAMHARNFVPDLTLCSTAARARQTLEGVAMKADTGRVHFLESLYSDDASGYIETVRRHGEHSTLLVVGHNPMMEDLAAGMSGDGDPGARSLLGSGFPPSGLAVLRFDGGLDTVGRSSGFLEAFVTPQGH